MSDPANIVQEGKELERDVSNLSGQSWYVGDGVSTDLIAPGRYFDLRSDLDRLAEHTLEDAQLQTTDEEFMQVFEPGDFVVAGENFGQGSSREHAAAIIERVGVSAVIAESFARIFYRNAINVGLPVITCDTSRISEGDELSVDLDAGVINNETTGETIEFDPLPPLMRRLLNDGGLVRHIDQHGKFADDLIAD
ncbi:3-isopropylmalate dehydratase [Salinarchaeum sp. IM2453]|uniref:LeuD/DmdB family oxidoreductase small subunit n=1 Tax=Salinarchaeum sp. IM2453 TaxID=2862870 RepID=UPI001C835E5E|nr:3-isopropylmalate dehydratase [Salinarchaeum sp. IM2453]QZA87850.1 3-isopropylmalate dehydratase [Salinarchaeum sp. IM2453]